MSALYIFIGGGLGSLMRYLVSVGLQSGERSFPLGTLVVNVLGSVLLGYLLGSTMWSERLPEDVRLGLCTGLLGGFTTFSTFGVETVKLCQAGEFGLVFCYIGMSIFGGLAAAYLGMRIAAG